MKAFILVDCIRHVCMPYLNVMLSTAHTHCLFNGAMYDQIDGVAIGSPLGPLLVNLFIGFQGSTWLRDYPRGRSGPSFNRRYADDMLCLFQSRDDVGPFLKYINDRYPPPFLRTKTFTGLLVNLTSSAHTHSNEVLLKR